MSKAFVGNSVITLVRVGIFGCVAKLVLLWAPVVAPAATVAYTVSDVLKPFMS